MSYFHIFLGRHNGTRTASIKYNLNEAISSARISSLSCASPFNNLISLSYSMLVFSANLLGLFQQILMCNNILRTCRNFLELKYLEKIFEKNMLRHFVMFRTLCTAKRTATTKKSRCQPSLCGYAWMQMSSTIKLGDGMYCDHRSERKKIPTTPSE